MNRKVLAGIAAGLLTTAALVLVGTGAYRAGQRSDATIEVVGTGVEGGADLPGRMIVLAGDSWRGGWHGPGPGIFVFPLIVIGLIVLVVSRRGPGRGGWPGGRGLDEWHRQAHAAPVPTAPAVGDSPPPSSS